ncbi:MAG TPA: hypothetical protein VG167_16335 [Verrucomicrobiae bacterium]|nr:hypothetical protein [Verrucomicrobiae bacterium]
MNETPTGRVEPVVTALPWRNVSWGAIWAGMFVTVVLEIMFTLLGVACGIATLNPLSNPASEPGGLSFGAAIWLMVSWLISMWCGAYVSGWMSGGPRRSDGRVHGIVAWSFAAAVILLLLSGAAGTYLVNSMSGESGMNKDNHASALNNQAQPMAPTGRNANSAQPNNLNDLANNDPQLAGALSQIENSKGGSVENSPAWSQALNILRNNYNMSQQQARHLLKQLNTSQSGQGTGVANSPNAFGDALWGFIALILGLAVAAWGGGSGAASSERTLRPVVA